ncbi:SLBB domain-containing protein [Dictyoglomus thermophilum]|uniref:Polysaccharide biosynthesis/export protein, putative n=1 Tax=Dictyoglomus thermophilum (strain ATCC 35947 / DSM 3960 / H-6-12) TaxID=309799 RepID=B5YCS5_DICT6|nr:SLBB domain-containing protein [Dictyoglomus thermophilum]ACI18334.1 polysaccharide biosynthesis/export protein, putative [Dictyoglomus thermophilum H-6-12]
MKRAILVLILLIASFSLIYAQEAPSLGEVYSGKVIEPDKYVLGPGDVLRIFVVQENNKTESFTVSVSPTGFIFLPLVGSIKVLNLTLSDATKEISRQLVRFYPRSNIYVDLINVKKVNILITGEVANPGNYKVSALSTLDDVLKIAGGLKASASYRRIFIKRGEKVLELDYLKFLKYGDTSQNPYVEEGDFIYVPLMGDRVKILGRVKSPGEYEVKDGERLKDVLDMAGGLAINASLFDATLDRVDGTRIYLDLYGLYYGDKERKDKANIELKDGDSITVLTETKRVYVLGFVANPGPIQLVEEIKTGPQGEEIGGVTQAVVGAKISELIKEAGGVLPNGSTRRIELRRGGKESDKIIIDLYRVLVLGEESEEDIKVNPGDVIYVPPVLKSVKILGQVRNPGVYEIVEGDRIREILLKAGGLTEKAAREGGELVRLENGKKLTYKFNVVNALQGIEKDNLELKDGDTLYIPELRRLVYVLGQVNNPAAYEYREGRKLTEYISMAGGFKDRADLSRIAIVREINGETKVIPINVNEIVNKGRSDLDITIEENDIIFVPEVFIKGWQDIVNILSGIFYVYSLLKPIVGW